MRKDTRSIGGVSNVLSAVSLLIILVVGYVTFQLLYPVYAFQSLKGAMEEGIKITVQSSDDHHTEMLEEIRRIIDRHNIPLDPVEIRIEHDPERRVLSVSAEYDVYVEFPGYTHYYHFEPYAEAEAR
jgi:hypothetical protein